MGCGQSKIDKIYPRKRKRRGCNKLSVDSDVDVDEADETEQRVVAPNDEEDEDESRKKAAAKVRQLVSSGPLLAHTETSSSQLDFFKLLDEKIEEGPDYDATSEVEVTIERARLAALIRDWETASCSSSRSLPSTPGNRKSHPQTPLPPQIQKQYYRPQLQQQNGDLYTQQQYYQHFQQQQQQYQNIRGQFFMPQQPMYQYPRVYPPPMSPKGYQNVQLPQPQASSVVQYRKSRGVYTELA